MCKFKEKCRQIDKRNAEKEARITREQYRQRVYQLEAWMGQAIDYLDDDNLLVEEFKELFSEETEIKET